MFLMRHPVSPRLVFALALMVCVLPGCGGSSNNSPPHISRFAGGPANFDFPGGTEDTPRTYSLPYAPDPQQPFVVAADGNLLQPGTDYSLDTNMPTVLHINANLSTVKGVSVTYTAPPSITEVFAYTHGSKPILTLNQPIDFTEPVAVDFAAASLEAVTKKPVSNQNYTIQAISPAKFRLTNPFTSDGQLGITYTPKAH